MKTVFITGANRGIGLALTKRYLQSGYQVHATYRSACSAKELLSLEVSESNLSTYCFDVTDYPTYPQLLAQLPNLDIVINNAGYYGPKGYGFGNTDIDEWRKVLEINTIAPLKLVEALYPKIQKSTIRKIACLSSKVGSMTENTSGGGYIYRSSKAALNSVVKSLSNDLSQEGITVLALHPGWVQTEMGGPNALISTTESASGLFKVIENANSNHSGQFINFDGQPLPW
ncbi:C-factor [Vibrio mediterranei]|uniref:Short-chain dehydrogenase n=1 Tax=Vibrio mediterranei TaxID=689 RepID=A0ABX5DBG2_9VIBR|nr:SDR family oxidoreductase [Vibrio mediterranei]MCG9660149.1 SDR family oxidoreductase [Vibrio mediterranei]MCG9662221.1 SDR family oxidoreductase [Vibrio mediterranei]NOH29157.1 SDR family oxidoreductase [Vibrio mediterranei]PCD88754.1 short-chain dehydrogenase [Vibrio mediterranei]PRQ66353.1 short-chain dehydrogenase [Vibrio mediterranei]